MKELSVEQLSLVFGGSKNNEPDLASYGVAFATGFIKGGALAGVSSASVNLALDLARSLPITVNEESLPMGMTELIPSSLPIKPNFGTSKIINSKNQSGSAYCDDCNYQQLISGKRYCKRAKCRCFLSGNRPVYWLSYLF